MSDTALTKAKRKTVADYKAAIAHLITEMDRIEERMDRDRAETERLKIETQIIKARTDANLARLQEQINSLTGAE
jgi:hypothetical protein